MQVANVKGTIFDIDDVPVLPDLVKEYEYQEYLPDRPEGSVETTTSQITMNVNDRDSFVYMPDAFLQVQCQLVEGDNTTLHTTDECTIGGFWHLFRRVELWAGTQQVAYVDYPGPISTALTAVESKKTELESASSELFFVDEPQTFSGLGVGNTPTADDHRVGAKNDSGAAIIRAGGTGGIPTISPDTTDIYLKDSVGTQERLKITGSSKNFTMRGPLKRLFKVLGSYPRVSRGIQWSLRVERNEHGRALYSTSAEANNSSWLIKDMSLWVPVVKPRIEVEAALLSKMKQGTVSFRYLHMEYNRFSPQNYSSGTTINEFTRFSHRPRKIMVFFQRTSRKSQREGAVATDNDYATANPAVFDSLDIRRIHVRVDGKQFPAREYQQTFDSDVAALNTRGATDDVEPIRLYDAFLQFGGHQLCGDGCEPAISFKTWMRSYPIYCFNIDYENSIYKESGQYDVALQFQIGTHDAAINAECTMVSFGEAGAQYDMRDGVMSFKRVMSM